MSTKYLIRRSEYHDSVTLMETARELTRLSGVLDAAVVMATDANKEILREAGLLLPEIVVATDMAYPPFTFAPRKGPKGLDIALMDEIARRVGFEVEYRNARFDFIPRGLVGGVYDASISAMTITGNREAQADFSEPYYVVSEALVVRAEPGAGSGASSAQDLGDDATLGARRGTAGAGPGSTC